MKRVILKKGNKMFVGISTSVYKVLGLESPETVRRWIRGKKFKVRNGYEVYTDVEELKKEK